MKNEISISDILRLSSEEFTELFEEEGGSIVVVPPQGYTLNFSKVRTTEDVIDVLEVLCKMILPQVLFLSDREYEDSPIKHLLDKVTT
jgi:hypothetical protein